MTFIDTYRGDGCTRHLVETRERYMCGGDWRWLATTRCGRTVRARHSGECAASLIDCGNCRRSMATDDREE